MTQKELVKELEKHDKDAEVVIEVPFDQEALIKANKEIIGLTYYPKRNKIVLK